MSEEDRFRLKAKEIREAHMEYIKSSGKWPGAYLEDLIARALKEESEREKEREART